MFALARLLLPDQPGYRTGVILVGPARCIAMVLIWNDLACGGREMAVLVALNALFQVVTHAALGYFYLRILPGWLGLATTDIQVSMGGIARTVLVFLGIPPAAGYLTRILGKRIRGRQWYEQTFLPKIGPVALYGLRFHRRDPLRAAGRHHHRPAVERRPHRVATAGLLRPAQQADDLYELISERVPIRRCTPRRS
jgi:ACR3 family arsenite transporter